MDRLYTSIPTANCFSREITVVGTLQTNRLGLPDELKNPKDRDEFQSTIHWEKEHGNHCLVCIHNQDKIQRKEKCFSFVNHATAVEVTKDYDKDNPAVIKVFNFTKGVMMS